MYVRCEQTYKKYMGVLWPNLSRFNNLLIIINISMFFLSGLVANGYFFTFFSVGCFAVVAILMMLPLPFMDRLWFYLLHLLLEFVGFYFLVASILYWIRTGSHLPIR